MREERERKEIERRKKRDEEKYKEVPSRVEGMLKGSLILKFEVFQKLS